MSSCPFVGKAERGSGNGKSLVNIAFGTPCSVWVSGGVCNVDG